MRKIMNKKTVWSEIRIPSLIAIILLLLTTHAFGMGLGTPPSPPPAPFSATFLSSIPTNNGDPMRIAYNGTGMVYAAVPSSGKILKFTQDGTPAGSINGFTKPISVAVDGSGRMYVGDDKDGSVSVMGPAGTVLFSLGRGAGEFGKPGDIAVASNGSVYVTDSKNHVVKVFSSNGASQFSFGGYGTGAGQMDFPAGIAVDNTNSEVYVVDLNNARVEVFSLTGSFVRSFGSFGSSAAQFVRPQGIHVANGKVFVTDAFQGTVQVFDRTGNVTGQLGQTGSAQSSLTVPLGVVVNGTKVFVSNANDGKIKVYEVLDPNGLALTPSALTFNASVNANPTAQTVQVDAQVAGSALAWTESVDSPFPIVLDQTTGTTPSTVTVSVNVTGLVPGIYSGTVKFRANGVDYPLTVNLNVAATPPPQQELLVAPASLDMFFQKDSPLSFKAVSVTSTGGSLQWTASAGVPWLDVSPASGSTPGTVAAGLNQNVNTLAEGVYTATLSVTSPGALGSPASVPVTLRVVVAGTITVSTNLTAATFTISGPSPNTGSGTTWKTNEAKPGTYTIEFAHVKGYLRPETRTFDLATGKSVTIDVQYKPLRQANAIVAAKGPDSKNDALLRVFDLQGNLVTEFRTFDTKYGARVATGDIDGDGYDEIIVVPGPDSRNKASVRIFRFDGSPLVSSPSFDKTEYGASVAAGDIDGDGRYEIAVSMVGNGEDQAAENNENKDNEKKNKANEDGGGTRNTIIIYSVDSSYRLVEKTRLSLAAGKDEHGSKYPANLAFGDVNGDHRPELIVLQGGAVRVYAFDANFSPSLIASGTANRDHEGDDYASLMTVSAGDINGDGTDEILLGSGSDKDSVVHVLRGDLTDYGFSFTAFAKGESAPALSSMESNGDGLAEILAGEGASSDNDSTLRIYDSKGKLLREINAFGASAHSGANAAFGVKR